MATKATTREEDGYTFTGAMWSEGEACKRVDENRFAKELKEREHVVWAIVVAEDVHKTARLLIEEFNFHALEVEDALHETERPELKESGQQLFMVIPAWVEDGSTPRFVEIGCFLSEKYLVTVVSRAVPALDAWLQRWQDKPETVGANPAMLLHALLDDIVDRYFPAVDALQEKLDELEDEIFRGGSFDVRRGLVFKRRLLEMRRRIAPLREIVNGLLRRDLAAIPEEVKPYFLDVYDHVLRVLENIDVSRDILSSVLDAHLTITSNRLNEVMRFMTGIATILMTDALIAGIYGMNFKFMPELNQRWGYPMALALMAIASLGEWIYFRRKGWL